MKLLKNNLSEHEVYWSLQVFSLLKEMATQKTNAVLQVLAEVEHLESDRRYPESGLLFADNRWRAFYHCHETTSMHPDEHGHFHIFTDLGKQDWAHVAGLSIDAEGQPIQWFMVNRWVTDGVWLKSDDFFKQLAFISASHGNDGLVANWLAGLLQLYRSALSDLLEKRDAMIGLQLRQDDEVAATDDRELYTLAAESINLLATLKKPLVSHHLKAGQQIIERERVRQGAACTNN